MGEWRKARLVEIAAKKRWALNGGPFGSKLTTKHYTDSGVPVIRGTNLAGGSRFSFEDFVWVSEDKADELLPNNAHPGDLVFTQRGTIGQVGLIPLDAPFKRFVISQSQMKLTPDPEQVDALFLYYFFSSPGTVKNIENLAFAAGVPHINLEILRNFEAPLPPLPVQRRIASILSAYDELIENSQRRINILEAMARALYREWFAHFRFPGHENHPRVASPLGEIPRGWEVVALGSLCEVTDYVANGSFAALKANVTYRDEPDYAVLVRGTDFNSGWDGEYVYVTERSYRFLKKSALLPGDIVVTNVGNVGITFLVPDLGRPVTLGPNSVLVRPRKGAAFFFLFLRSEEGQHGIKRITSGVAQPKFNKTDFRALQLVVPSDGVLQDFDRNIRPLNSLAEQLRRQIQNLRRTRDLLLPRLLSGQIDVEAA